MSFALLTLLALGQTEAPAPKPARLPLYGLNAGSYVPASPTVRARFGENWLSFSPGIGPVLPMPIPALSPDFSLATQRRTVGSFNNRAFMAILGAQYQWPLFTLYAEEGKPFRLPTYLPYAGVSLGGLYANLRSEADSVNSSGFAPAGSVYIGTSIGRSSFFEARWRAVGKVHGFNLSGLDLGVGLRF
jgi:hypothetical protein